MYLHQAQKWNTQLLQCALTKLLPDRLHLGRAVGIYVLKDFFLQVAVNKLAKSGEALAAGDLPAVAATVG